MKVINGTTIAGKRCVGRQVTIVQKTEFRVVYG
jgi:hypothetical protein